MRHNFFLSSLPGVATATPLARSPCDRPFRHSACRLACHSSFHSLQLGLPPGLTSARFPVLQALSLSMPWAGCGVWHFWACLRHELKNCPQPADSAMKGGGAYGRVFFFWAAARTGDKVLSNGERFHPSDRTSVPPLDSPKTLLAGSDPLAGPQTPPASPQTTSASPQTLPTGHWG